ncbi:hypothetical protein JEQ12_011762 [Ovis aries]|uniref:Methylguanine DNA methyltransferase ribonuclease-like domain-containing protein n=1 Tax=Ovis aries TaxID=9940 RepID=A0A835ZQE3_SHEEP|nr:hypothetical protein JEQ12_011762 [Ovis aries]
MDEATSGPEVLLHTAVDNPGRVDSGEGGRSGSERPWVFRMERAASPTCQRQGSSPGWGCAGSVSDSELGTQGPDHVELGLTLGVVTEGTVLEKMDETCEMKYRVMDSPLGKLEISGCEQGLHGIKLHGGKTPDTRHSEFGEEKVGGKAPLKVPQVPIPKCESRARTRLSFASALCACYIESGSGCAAENKLLHQGLREMQPISLGEKHREVEPFAPSRAVLAGSCGGGGQGAVEQSVLRMVAPGLAILSASDSRNFLDPRTLSIVRDLGHCPDQPCDFPGKGTKDQGLSVLQSASDSLFSGSSGVWRVILELHKAFGSPSLPVVKLSLETESRRVTFWHSFSFRKYQKCRYCDHSHSAAFFKVLQCIVTKNSIPLHNQNAVINVRTLP